MYIDWIAETLYWEIAIWTMIITGLSANKGASEFSEQIRADKHWVMLGLLLNQCAKYL